MCEVLLVQEPAGV